MTEGLLMKSPPVTDVMNTDDIIVTSLLSVNPDSQPEHALEDAQLCSNRNTIR